MKQPKAHSFLPIFLITLMVTVELLSLAVIGMIVQNAPILIIIGSVMVMADTAIYRMLAPPHPALLRLRRFAGCMAAMLVTGLSLAGTVGTLVVSGSLSAMLGGTVGAADIPVVTSRPATEPFAVYLSGSDTRDNALTQSRSDVNILAVLSPANRQLLLVNTPRDYYVSNPAGNGAGDKLAHCGLYGAENSAQALANLYGVPITYTAQINFKGFETLIDALGGVTVVSDTAFTAADGTAIVEGENTLNGAQALSFARERSHLAGGDADRGRNQMKLLMALAEQVSPANLLGNYSEILRSLDGMFTTTMPLRTITKLVTDNLNDLDEWEMFSCSVTGTDSTEYNYSSGCSAYVMVPDAASVRHASELMQRMLNGDAITAADVA